MKHLFQTICALFICLMLIFSIFLCKSFDMSSLLVSSNNITINSPLPPADELDI